jgi:molecular chaperone GrpE
MGADDTKADRTKEDAKEDPQLRVVDRRWWARADAGEAGAEPAGSVRKPTYVEDLERRLADTTTQLQTALAERRRSGEEFEQARTRIRRDVARDVERAKRAVLGEMLEVLDNLDRAVAASREAPASTGSDQHDSLVRGVALVREQFLAKLESLGVTRMQALDTPFDAARHEAVTTAPVEPANDGRVVAVLKEGYTIGDEILRPAAVVVGRADVTE